MPSALLSAHKFSGQKPNATSPLPNHAAAPSEQPHLRLPITQACHNQATKAGLSAQTTSDVYKQLKTKSTCKQVQTQPLQHRSTVAASSTPNPIRQVARRLPSTVKPLLYPGSGFLLLLDVKQAHQCHSKLPAQPSKLAASSTTGPGTQQASTKLSPHSLWPETDQARLTRTFATHHLAQQTRKHTPSPGTSGQHIKQAKRCRCNSTSVHFTYPKSQHILARTRHP